MAEVVRKITVALIRPAAEALDTAAALEGLSMADTVNRALQLWGLVTQQQAAGGVLLIRGRDGRLHRVHQEPGTTRADPEEADRG